MPKSQFLLSSASGVLAGALLFGASPAFAQFIVVDWVNNAVQVAIKGIEQTMSNTLSSITNQLTATGPLGTLLGSAQFGSVTALLQQGFTQNANYAKAAVDAQSQIVDGALTSNARFQRDMRNAGIRDEHTTSSLHCVALDSGQTVTVSGGQSWKVTPVQSQDVADVRGEAGPNQPAFYGQSSGRRGDRAAAFRPLLLATRGDRRPLLPPRPRTPTSAPRPCLEPARCPQGGRDGRQRLRDQPRPADRSRRVARRPIDLGSRPRRQHPSPRL